MNIIIPPSSVFKIVIQCTKLFNLPIVIRTLNTTQLLSKFRCDNSQVWTKTHSGGLGLKDMRISSIDTVAKKHELVDQECAGEKQLI